MAHRAPIILVASSADWPRQFQAEATRLAAHLPAHVVLAHVGSTAVPGLAAKPIIDMMLGAQTLNEIAHWVPTLRTLGYDYLPEHEAQLPERRFFAWPLTRPRHFHLHAVVHQGPFWQAHVQFRDRLRANPSLAQDYAALKHRLAQQYGDDRAAYTEAKTAFILQALQSGS